MKRFINHPAEFPIVVSTAGSERCDQTSLCHLSDGCLTCHLLRAFSTGEPVTLEVPAICQPCTLLGNVANCHRCGEGFRLNIRFEDDDEIFKSKMLEQVCQIEHYRRELLRKGRALDRETAAYEWIEQYSDQFSAALTR